ncbi:MAG: hypothetical protein DWQ19_12990 [Crenarchaeota archaeon]|nr:MAG: hypothetical protein DWQ19_12990 [Thermoproteota archaeon]
MRLSLPHKIVAKMLCVIICRLATLFALPGAESIWLLRGRGIGHFAQEHSASHCRKASPKSQKVWMGTISLPAQFAQEGFLSLVVH